LRLVLRLVEDERERAFLVAQPLERVAVVVEQRIAVAREQRGLRIRRGDEAGLVARRARALIMGRDNHLVRRPS
jgi:hypothetical protein